MNYAVIGGKVSGDLVIFDLDDPSLLPLLFKTTVDKIMETKLTRLVKTKMGYHLYFRDKNHVGTGSRDMRNSRTPLLSFDMVIRADHGYVVGPGSLNPDGITYEAICDIPPKAVDLRRMMNELVLPNMGYLVLSRIIEPAYVKGIRYEMTLALGTYLYTEMNWDIDRILEFFEFHDKYLELHNMDKHRSTTIDWLSDRLESMDKQDLLVGRALNDDLIREIVKFKPYIEGDRMLMPETYAPAARIQEETATEYWFDKANGVAFTDGNLYRLTATDQVSHRKTAPQRPREADGSREAG
jgi:hypothetical protein